MGGIGHLSLGSYEGEQTTYTPAGAKLNWDGTLSATRVKVATKAQTSTRQLQPPENNILDEFRWANLAIYLNQAEPPSSPKALDQAIRKELLQDIWQREASLGKLAAESGILGLYCLWFGGLNLGLIAKLLGATTVYPILDRSLQTKLFYDTQPEYLPKQKLSTQFAGTGTVSRRRGPSRCLPVASGERYQRPSLTDYTSACHPCS